ncbi:MAG: DUF2232 domain-containing protein [Clostridia bacterium]|nr:DUF2232 domain-containing protein [Clostridia bacterium]
MNETSTENEFVNPWENRSLFPEVSKKHTILAALICLLCSAGLPLCGNVWIAPVLMLLLCGYVAYAARSPFTILLILLTAFSAMMFGMGFGGVAAILALIAGSMTLAYLFTTLKMAYLALLLPIAGFAVAFAVTRDWRVSLFSFSFLPAGLLLSLATVKGKNRTSAICFAEVGFLISVLVLIAFLIYDATGGLGRGQILAYINGIRDGITQEFLSVRDEFLKIAAEVSNEQSKAVAEMFASMFSEDVVAQIFNLLPAVTVVVCSILAFESQLLLGVTYFNTGLSALLPREARIFTMSVTAAVLYTLSFLVMLFAPTTSMAVAVIQNVCLILLPGFAILGVQSLVMTIARARGAMRVLFVFLVFAMLCCSGGGLYLLAMWGAYCRVMEALQRKLTEKLKQMRGDDSDGEDKED